MAIESIQIGSKEKLGRGVVLLLVVSAVFYALGFIHPRADFPNSSPWSDWSKMTDEGWYGSAAIQHYLQGRWYLPGSFNPAVAMPVWPAMLGALFAFAGVSMAAARVLTMLLYGVSLLLLYKLVRREQTALVASLAVLVTVVNPFCYAFNRLAVLEPVTVFWLMLSLWLATKVGGRQSWKQILLGIILCLLVLTKPTGVALVPAVLYLLWATGEGSGWFVWARLRPAVVALGTMLVLWLGYQRLWVRPRFIADYRLLFSINDYRVHLSIVPKMTWITLRDGGWINPVLFPLGLVFIVLSVVWLRELWRSPLFVAAVLASAGQLAYIGYHTNFQPRYYEVVALPLSAVLLLAASAVWQRKMPWSRLVLGVGLGVLCLVMGVQTLDDVLHPQYSFLMTAQSIAVVVDADNSVKPLLLADSGGDIALFTGVPAICASYSTDSLPALLQRYQPGWFAAWPGWDDTEIEQVRQLYKLREVARYQVFDDPRRKTLVLYKMMPR